MAGIKSKNTKPEIYVRKSLHKRGFRYRLHANKIIGKPDLSLGKYNAIIFINGCFWHKHDCNLFKMPKTRRDFWSEKLNKNKARDEDVTAKLLALGIRVCIIWECSLKNKRTADLDAIIDIVENWLRGNHNYIELTGASTMNREI